MNKAENGKDFFFKTINPIKNSRPCIESDDMKIMLNINEAMETANSEYISKVEMSHRAIMGFHFSR